MRAEASRRDTTFKRRQVRTLPPRCSLGHFLEVYRPSALLGELTLGNHVAGSERALRFCWGCASTWEGM